MNIIDLVINFFASLACPTFGCSQEDLEKMMIKKGYRKDYVGFIMPDDIVLDEDPRA